MIRKCLMVAMVVAIGCVVAAPAQAGGSTGTKKVATIRVLNATTTPGQAVGVTPAAPNATNTASLSAFQAAGGQILSVGQVGSFKVPAGASTLYGSYYPLPAVLDATNSGNVGVTGVAGKTGYVRVTGDSTAPTFNIAGSATKF